MVNLAESTVFLVINSSEFSSEYYLYVVYVRQLKQFHTYEEISLIKLDVEK